VLYAAVHLVDNLFDQVGYEIDQRSSTLAPRQPPPAATAFHRLEPVTTTAPGTASAVPAPTSCPARGSAVDR
jgi:hypothetical protein